MKIILLSFLISFNVYAIKSPKEQIGKIIKMKGSGTKLAYHKNNVQKIKVGDVVLAESSIISNKNSYITIALENRLSYLKLGKETKVEITYSAQKKQYNVRLYTGYIKVLFKRTPSAQKMVIHTTNAMFDIINSKALITYNEFLGMSSVVNYKGYATISNRNKSSTEVPPLMFSYIDQDKNNPSIPNFLEGRQYLRLINSFKIDEEEQKSLNE